MIDRILSFLVALSLALLVWLYARSRDQEILDNVPIPVHITLPDDLAEQYILEQTGPAQVMVSFTGPPLRIRELRGMLQRSELSVDVTLTVPEERLNESRYSDTVIIESSDIHAPPGVTPMVLEGRNRIPVTLHRVVERPLPVRFEHNADEPNIPVVIEPPTVLVRGPQEVLDKLRAADTAVRNTASGCEHSRRSPAGDRRPAGARYAESRDGAGAAQSAQGVRDTRRAGAVPVPAGLQPAAVFPRRALRPRDAARRRPGPGRAAEGASVHRPDAHGFIEGMNHEPLQIQLPKDFQLAQEPPHEVCVPQLDAGRLCP